MIELIKICLWISLLPLSFTLLLDVCLGMPGSKDEFDTKAIFFSISFFFAKLRLKKYRKYFDIYNGFKEALTSKDVYVQDIANKAFKGAVFSEGRDFFTWEKGFGMCPRCTNVRIAILTAIFFILYFKMAWILILIVPCFSNMFLLIYNKLKS